MNKGIGIKCADIYLRFPEIMEEEVDDLADFLEDEKIRYEGATDTFIDLQKKAELGETYKKLYGEIKKQKDDVVGYIKEQIPCIHDEEILDDILRMLGEIE